MKRDIGSQRAEMIRHLLAAKQIAGEVNEQTIEFYLENTLIEAMGDLSASEALRRLAVN
jgi:hypothetical protein